jgi:alpha-beta hydrolase superfamily lysophospholipase
MKRFLRDVHHYLYDERFSPRPGETYNVRQEIRRRFVDTLKQQAAVGKPHIVVSHSMGTVIAYDCLKQVADCPAVDGLVTLGSPLGLDEVQVKLAPGYTEKDGFPSGRLQGSWSNVFDPGDIVAAFDPKLADDYKRAGKEVIEDLSVHNGGSLHHSITHYLGTTALRRVMRGLLGVGVG